RPASTARSAAHTGEARRIWVSIIVSVSWCRVAASTVTGGRGQHHTRRPTGVPTGLGQLASQRVTWVTPVPPAGRRHGRTALGVRAARLGALSGAPGLAFGRRSGGRSPPGSYPRRASRAGPVEPRGQDRAEPGQPAEDPDQ